MRNVLVPAAIAPALPPPGSILRDAAGASMGTAWSARMMVPPGVRSELGAQLQRELDGIVAEMSHWEPDSVLGRYNRAPAGSWHPLPPRFLEVMAFALEAAADSGGAYDPFAGELVNLWGFGPSGRHDEPGFAPPTPQAVGAALARRALAQPALDGARLLQPGGLQLDLSSTAKGYAVDRLAWCLEQHGVLHYVVEIGGELRGAGMKRDGQPWWVELEAVPGLDTAPTVAALHGLAIATSGDYRRHFSHGGAERSHTIDPRSGAPIANGVASCTVLHARCMAADVLSTAITVLGAEAGLAFAEERQLAARLLLRRGDRLEECTTGAWRALLQ